MPPKSPSPSEPRIDPAAFASWLQGYVELVGTRPTPRQWRQIKDHLALVFVKVTPDRTGGKLDDLMSPPPTYCHGLSPLC